MYRIVTGAVAGLCLLVGFALAELTGLRWIGAVVVLGGAGWCLGRVIRAVPWWRWVAILAIGLACFVTSHLLAGLLGAWPAVIVAAAILALATVALTRPSTRSAPRAGIRDEGMVTR